MRALLLAAAALLVAGCDVGGGETTATTTRTVTEAAPADTAPAETIDAPVGGSLADTIERVVPSVVYVRTTTVGGGNGEGSGVVVDSAGIIVTNNHVVDGASTISVSFNDGRHSKPLPATVVGTAPERDLAVLRVEATDLVPIRIASSAALRLGDDVIALGFPLGLGGPTVTRGIVSGLDRTVEPENGTRLQGLLQTDAAINPGNSGGALVDRAGRLVGINTAAAIGGSAENIGFAIAIDGARPVIEEIRSQPQATRAWLGAAYAAVESDAAAIALGLDPSTRGVRITQVFPGGPAAAAGIEPGDVVVALEDARVRSTEELIRALTKLDPGDTIELELIDTVGPRRTRVTVERRPVVGG